ncbi:VaFE repeat-containing surface-anchored protein, partial [Rhodovulum adriaticum]|uniref:VaFE repeat-containing surface-anchored protein n=1 Tax=Rhodovulum adriaticum TaxID=35804 RepID=UPI001903F627
AGSSIVAVETLKHRGVEIAKHYDLEDENQTVEVKKPNVGTSASYVDGSKEQTANENMTIVDIVKYDGLIKGQKYTVEGILMDKETNKPLVVNGKQVTSSTTFIAETESGEIEVRFTFDGSQLAGKELVVFEKLYHVTADDKVLIASHEDINDESQTVKINRKPVIKKEVK